MFRKFVLATGYQSEIDSFGLGSVFIDMGEVGTGPLAYHEYEWVLVEKANWQYPLGFDDKKADDQELVTQVSWNDASAYCEWAGGQLPSLAEWLDGVSVQGVERYDKFSWSHNQRGLAEWVLDSASATYRKIAGEVYLSGHFPFSRGTWAHDRSANLLTFRCKFDNP